MADQTRVAEEITSREDVISRLRESKARMEEARLEEAYAAGQRWAEARAEAEELTRLEELEARHPRGHHEWDLIWSTDGNSAYGPGESFVFTIRPETDGERGVVAEFWLEEAGIGDTSLLSIDGYVRSFVEGALDVWDEVKDQL